MNHISSNSSWNPLDCCWSPSQEEEESDNAEGGAAVHRITQEEVNHNIERDTAARRVTQESESLYQRKVKEICDLEKTIKALPNSQKASELLEEMRERDLLKIKIQPELKELNAFKKKNEKDPDFQDAVKEILEDKQTLNNQLQFHHQRIEELKKEINSDPDQQEGAKLLTDLESAKEEATKLFAYKNWAKNKRDVSHWTPQQITEDWEIAKEQLASSKFSNVSAQENSDVQNSKKDAAKIALNLPQTKNVTFSIDPNDHDMGHVFEDVESDEDLSTPPSELLEK